jgi:hypothetical protein
MAGLYVLALEQFAYHLETVLLLSQMLTGKARQNAFIRLAWTILMRRDYAERLNANSIVRSKVIILEMTEIYPSKA